MKLCYRGATYERNPRQFKIVDTEETARFRGNYYIVHRVALDAPLQKKSGLVYRGVSEDTGKPTLRFLGRKYNIASVFVEPIKAIV